MAEEFSTLYIFHLRGNSRTSGERAKKEGGNVFEIRTPVAIMILVKNPKSNKQGQIYFHDIGDYLSKKEKLKKISDLIDINGIYKSNGWEKIIPDEHNDWVNQRDDSLSQFVLMGDKKDKLNIGLFENYSLGVGTNRDSWAYQSSKKLLVENIKKTIRFYNENLIQSDIPNIDVKNISW